MVQLLALVWRRLLRKRWVLGIVFGLPLIYFLSSTFKQEERALRDRNFPQAQDEDRPIAWKVQFSLGNSSQPNNQCRNSVQGKLLITDELGYICERKDLLVNGCCNVEAPSVKLYSCDSCLPSGCCSIYEACVSCCLQPNKQQLLEHFLNRAAMAFRNLFMAVEDHFELCLAKCRTSSQSVQHENTYRNPIAKYCYGEYPRSSVCVKVLEKLARTSDESCSVAERELCNQLAWFLGLRMVSFCSLQLQLLEELPLHC